MDKESIRKIDKALDHIRVEVEDMETELKMAEELTDKLKEGVDFLNYRGYQDAADLLQAYLDLDQEPNRYWQVLENKFPVKN
jgi:hypothetical protein